MLFVVFQVGDVRYALAGAQVAEVLPAVVWTPVSGTAAGVIGIINYHGAPVPLVDAHVLLGGGEAKGEFKGEFRGTDTLHAQLRLHSRILVVRPNEHTERELAGRESVEHVTTSNVPSALIGVLVDCVLGTIRQEARDFVDAGTVARGAPYLGPVLTDRDGLVQRIEPAHLLPQSVRDEVLRQWSRAV